MRQRATDRWMEAAEARRVCQIAQQMRVPPTAQTGLVSVLVTKLGLMVRPGMSDRRPVRAVMRSPA